MVTPWNLGTALADDRAARETNTGSGIRVGKVTMPAGIPGGHMLLVWSPGAVTSLNRPVRGEPDMKIAYAPNGFTPKRTSIIVLA